MSSMRIGPAGRAVSFGIGGGCTTGGAYGPAGVPAGTKAVGDCTEGPVGLGSLERPAAGGGADVGLVSGPAPARTPGLGSSWLQIDDPRAAAPLGRVPGPSGG
eukprot:6820065-Alexandrium_andersonii.AAC.1